MTQLDIVQIPVLSDNYVYLVREPESGAIGVVDPSVADPVIAELDRRGWTPTHILNTHHHPDHVGGNRAIKARYGCTVVGPAPDEARIPGIDVTVDEGDDYHFGNATARVLFVPGHTSGHIAYWFAGDGALFCGDTLFAMGCGRLFEGTPEQMWSSLKKFLALPDEARVYCAHEYTQANGRFALTVDPDNMDLKARMDEVARLREAGRPTVPSTMAAERATNPFLRPDDPAIRQALGMEEDSDTAVFAEIRKRKDQFRG